MRAPTVIRLFSRDVYASVGIVLLAFLALFWFFDLINELGDIGEGGYKTSHALLFTLLHLPSRLYELMPVAALIGGVYAMARLASNSEFTILRGAGLGPLAALRLLLGLGAVLAVITFLFGEFVAPIAEESAQKIAAVAKNKAVSGRLQSGHWVRNVREPDGTVETINVLSRKDGSIEQLTLFRFDARSQLVLRAHAMGATHLSGGDWMLQGVTLLKPSDRGMVSEQHAEWRWDNGPNPDVLNVSFVGPDQMTARDLWSYTAHLRKSGQVADRYELALWKKLIYPLTALVMMALALPFAYLHARSGGVSIRVFGGIMLGLSFVLLNGLSTQIGLLANAPTLLAAAAPSLLFMLIAIAALLWVMRVH
jgi:lipopolysaccharide export system permease protein